MTEIESDEYNLIIVNLENLRSSLNIEMQEIDEHAELGTNTYSRIIKKKQPIRVDELISIGTKIYNLKAIQILNANLKIPAIRSLPIAIREIAKERIGKTIRTQEKRDIIQYSVIILKKHFKVKGNFTNSQIKGYLNEELKGTFKNKSIEWGKSVLSSFIEDTGKTQPGKTKPEKVYKLLKKIPSDMVNKAEELVGSEWLGS